MIATRMRQAAAGNGGINIPTDTLVLWYKSSAGTLQTVGGVAAVADDDPVGEWADQSVTDNNATQATSDNRPLLKLNITGGQSILRFDGSNDSLLLNTPSGMVSASMTVFAVGRLANTSGNKMLIAVRSSSGEFHIGAVGATFEGRVLWGGVSLPGGHRRAGDTNYHIFRLVSDGVNSYLYVDGNVGTLANQLAAGGGVRGRIGGNTDNTAGQLLNGDIGEVLIYNSALSAGDIALVETYLGRFF